MDEDYVYYNNLKIDKLPKKQAIVNMKEGFKYINNNYFMCPLLLDRSHISLQR